MEINWSITTPEAAYILNALAERPFKEVNTLIGKLHSSTAQQVAEIEKAQKDGNSTESK